jgi:membrane protease YdiL (CAAX protease family)
VIPRENALAQRLHYVRRRSSGWNDIRSVILFYVLLLGTQAATLVLARATSFFLADVMGTGLMTIVIAAVAIAHRELLGEPFSRPGWGLGGYLLVLVASIPVILAVSAYVNGLSRLFRLHEESFLELYREKGLAWAFFLVAVVPPVIEETAFRGVIFGLLDRSLRTVEAILISSIAFGLLHLSAHSLITHVPLGLYLCWLRHRSRSIYPAIFAHFLHNAWAIVGEHYGVF